MPLSPAISSIDRAATHLSHVFEDWARNRENALCADDSVHGAGAPSSTPIDVIEQATRVLWRLTAVEKTLQDLQSPSPKANPEAEPEPAPAPHISAEPPADPAPAEEPVAATQEQPSIPDTSTCRCPMPSFSCTVPAVPQCPTVPALFSKKALKILAVRVQQEALGAQVISAADGVPLPDVYHLENRCLTISCAPGDPPHLVDIAKATRSLRAALKDVCVRAPT